MRRRRKKNTLLPKMIGLAVVINAVLLPLLARMGAFKKRRRTTLDASDGRDREAAAAGEAAHAA